jgi:flagellar basal-body rod protein FlgF
MDRAAYIAMNAASEALRAQSITAHNIANAGTSGFKALLTHTEAKNVDGPGWHSRVNGVLQPETWNAQGGALQNTGRDLDIALADDRWLAVQTEDGGVAYTRNGALQMTANGQVLDGEGRLVLSDNGPLTLPPHTDLVIAADGTVSLTPLGSEATVRAQVGRLNVIEAAPNELRRRADGLFEPLAGAEARPAAGAVMVSGMLEASNVNAAEQLVALIEHSRRFELATKAMATADQHGEVAQSLMRIR